MPAKPTFAYAKNKKLFIMSNPYEKLWKKVDSLQNQGLTKSALEAVDKIYEMAKAEKNDQQLIKAYIHRMLFRRNIEEKAFEQFIFEVETDIISAQAPLKQILHSLAAEMYYMYYQQNYWKFQDRSETLNFKPDDIETWTLTQLIDKSIKHYEASLTETEITQTTDLKNYTEILVKGTHDYKLQSTLYEFLMKRALNYFQNTQLTINKPADQFYLKGDFYFATAQEFITKEIKTADTLSLHFYAVRLYQELLQFNRENKMLDAFLFNDIERISFVYKNSTHPEKEKLYFDALEQMEKENPQNVYAAEASFLKATFFREKAAQYNFFQPETHQYKYKNVEAYKICNQIQDKFPKTNLASRSLWLMNEITKRTFSFETENYQMPKHALPVRISYKNIDKLYLRYLQITPEKLKSLQEKHNGEKLIEKLLKEAKTIYTSEYTLKGTDDYNLHSTEILLPAQNLGTYVVVLSTSSKFDVDENMLNYSFVQVSDLAYLHRQSGNITELTVLNRTTGHTVAGASVRAFYTEYDYKKRKYVQVHLNTYTSDANGKVMIEPKKDKSYSIEFEITKDADILSSDRSFYSYPYDYESPQTQQRVTLFTDRAIYRPGQTVFFKGLFVESTGNDHKLITAQNVSVSFYDVNYQVISTLDLTTNEYGTFNGTFIIPKGLLNGRMRIYTPYGEKYIQVEEYKRPQFEVEMMPFDGNYRLEDQISVKAKAKAYSGAMLTDAQVTYRITRKPIWRGWWSYFYKDSEVEIQNGTAKTNEKGEIELSFNAIPDYTIEKSDYLVFNYQIKIDVTDLNGETQSTTGNIVVGYKTLEVGIIMPKEVEISTFKKATLSTQNMNGEFLPAQGTVKFFKLKSNPNLERSKNWARIDEPLLTESDWDKLFAGNVYDNENDQTAWEKEKEIQSFSFDTKTSKELDFSMKNWEQGSYLAEVTSKDNFGQEVSSKFYFKVFDKNAEQLLEKTPFWFKLLNPVCEPGDTANLLIGSSYKDVWILYEVESQNKVIQSEWLKISEKQRLIKVPVHQADRGNLVVNIMSVVYNRKHAQTAIIFVPDTSKELDIEFSTFRDKLQPGQNEEWILKIKDAKGEKIVAEMLATLYDASLDVFAINDFYFNLYLNYYGRNAWQTTLYSVLQSQNLTKNFNTYHSCTYLYFDVLDWFGFGYHDMYYSYEMLIRATTAMSKNGHTKRKMAADKPTTGYEYAAESEEDAYVAEDRDEDISGKKDVPSPVMVEKTTEPEEIEGKKDVKIRTNFNETAFFYPNLYSNENGEIVIKFTVPESLTKWKMLGFAHTKDLKFGTAKNYLVTQKDLMVVPNAPRFFRESDKIIFPAKISNISDQNLSGKVELEIFDAVTMQKLTNIFANKDFVKSFEVNAQSNTAVSWELEIPENIGLLTYRIIAKTDKFSDGEEKAIPVLSNRMLVTETMPLPVRGSGTTEFEFEKLLKSKKSKTLSHHLLTLEFTSNPAWYAVQALPYMMEYPYECSEQTFSRYYANSIASHIANSTPKIKAVFDAWKQAGSDKGALLSNLEKNQELKEVLLQETPWVLDAKDESERKNRLGLLFDLNLMSSELQRALDKLKKEQRYNGGWSWFAGMPESRYITQHIVTGFGHLSKLGVANASEVEGMKTKAVGFLDEEIRDEYRELKKYFSEKEMKENHLSYMALQYLYGRSFYDIEIPKQSKEAFDYFLGQAQKYWLSQNLYGKGMIALVLKRYGHSDEALKIVASLTENSMSDKEMGMYWKENTGGYYWYQAPIETQALMIEVYAEVAEDSRVVDDLKVWLLKQKQVQDWKTTKATAEAVYALLLQGDDWLAETEIPQITLGNQTIDPLNSDETQVEAGTGYFKMSWHKSEITPDMGKVKVTKNSKGVAWGGLYWQYFEDLDKITPHETPLKLNKQLFVERLTDRGVASEPITEKTKLEVGDKIIVRIELRVDRQMEYVHMKDMRASGFEPLNVISRYKYQGGLGYYESTKDASTNFFMDYLPKGTYVFEYPLRVTHAGNFANGITTIQCMYAPEFTSHSEGIRVMIND
jgi:uncharacterized protein YfaS (alpha-2-macroglobulin family)